MNKKDFPRFFYIWEISKSTYVSCPSLILKSIKLHLRETSSLRHCLWPQTHMKIYLKIFNQISVNHTVKWNRRIQTRFFKDLKSVYSPMRIYVGWKLSWIFWNLPHCFLFDCSYFLRCSTKSQEKIIELIQSGEPRKSIFYEKDHIYEILKICALAFLQLPSSFWSLKIIKAMNIFDTINLNKWILVVPNISQKFFSSKCLLFLLIFFLVSFLAI